MLVLKYLLTVFGIGFLVGAAGILAYDLVQIFQQRRTREGESQAGGAEPSPGELLPPRSLRWNTAAKMTLMALVPLLTGLSIRFVPSGMAGVRISQFGGARPGALYPEVHGTIPLIETIELLQPS